MSINRGRDRYPAGSFFLTSAILALIGALHCVPSCGSRGCAKRTDLISATEKFRIKPVRRKTRGLNFVSRGDHEGSRPRDTARGSPPPPLSFTSGLHRRCIREQEERADYSLIAFRVVKAISKATATAVVKTRMKTLLLIALRVGLNQSRTPWNISMLPRHVPSLSFPVSLLPHPSCSSSFHLPLSPILLIWPMDHRGIRSYVNIHKRAAAIRMG